MSVRRLGLAAGAVAVLGIALALWRAFGPGGDDGRTARLAVDGTAEVTLADGRVELESGSRDVELGERITMVDGTAVLTLDGASFHLRDALDLDGAAGEPTSLVVADAPDLTAGAVLVEGSQRTPVVVDDALVTVDRGAAQVGREATGASVRAYVGRVGVSPADGVGDRVGAVEALRSLSVTAGPSVAGDTPPLSFRPADPWDRRFLGDAIAFGDELERKAIGLVQNLPARAEVDADFLRRTIPDLGRQEGFNARLVEPDREPAETLIGASIVALGRSGGVPVRWAEVFRFREAGAHWGLVALDQGVNEQPALELIDDAIGREELAFSGPPSTSPEPGPAPGPGPDPDPGPDPGPPTTPPPTGPPPTTPPEEPPDGGGPLPPTIDPVDDLVDDLLGGLLDDLLGGPGG